MRGPPADRRAHEAGAAAKIKHAPELRRQNLREKFGAAIAELTDERGFEAVGIIVEQAFDIGRRHPFQDRHLPQKIAAQRSAQRPIGIKLACALIGIYGHILSPGPFGHLAQPEPPSRPTGHQWQGLGHEIGCGRSLARSQQTFGKGKPTVGANIAGRHFDFAQNSPLVTSEQLVEERLTRRGADAWKRAVTQGFSRPFLPLSHKVKAQQFFLI